MYGYATLNADFAAVPVAPSDITAYDSFNDLKTRNANLKTILSFGGADYDTQLFETMASTEQGRNTFSQSAVNFAAGHGFDGINVDWRYPNSRSRFRQFLRDLRQEIDNRGTPFLLTASVSARTGQIDDSYDVDQLSTYVDFFNVMTYDFIDPNESLTRHHSPLYGAANETEDKSSFNTDFAMSYWRDKGTPVEKLNMGFATYGRTFTLSTQSSAVGAPTSGPAQAGGFTREAGFWSYYEVCSFLQGATVRMIDDQKVPYATKGNQWVGYDHKESFETKVAYMKEKRFGGAFIWALDLDDFKGKFCGDGDFTLIKYLRTLLASTNGNSPQPSRPTNAPPPPVNVSDRFCVNKPDGLYTKPGDPGSFYSCTNGLTWVRDCPANMHFKDICKCCYWPN
ncbi:acidic mammalian chitinase-like [Neosynchiropus ocellatus]